MTRWTSSDERRWWTALTNLAEQRIKAVLRAHEQRTPIYDPTQGAQGDGRTCSRCRKVSRSDARICGSCGTVLRMAP